MRSPIGSLGRRHGVCRLLVMPAPHSVRGRRDRRQRLLRVPRRRRGGRRSRRRTATRRRRSRSATSAGAGGVPAAARASGHEFPPHLINYRANLWALRSLGVRQVLAPCAVGGLRAEVAPGDLVVPDQLVDRTTGRVQTYVDGGAVHVPFADPYCPTLSAAVAGRRRRAARRHDGGHRGPAVLHARRVAALRRAGLDAGQHDRATPRPSSPASCGCATPPIALVTDMDAGVGVRRRASARRRCSRCSRRTSTASSGCSPACSADCPTPGTGCACASWADGLELPYEVRAVRVLLTGSAGFIGGAVAERLEAARRRGRRGST